MEWLAFAGDVLAFLTAVLPLIADTRRRSSRGTPRDENTGPDAAPEDPPSPLY
ncbi:hypothetical protein ACGFS9_30695 [Streptomyces sp. NPDC048566]|uniref:hypothetical protein n=1 Tax=Streptomyces sp. NPDC048566 TaxID=3365569 RepID=UPI00371A0BA0